MLLDISKLAADYVSLAHNSFVGTIPDFFGKLDLASFPDLSFNQLTGSIPLSIASMGFMQNNGFDVSNRLNNNLLKGPLPRSLLKLNPESISAVNACLTGTVPSWLSTLSNLQSLDISHNQLTGSLPSSLMATGQLCPNLGNNKFTGSLPDSIASLDVCFAEHTACSEDLEIFKGNQLSGTLPRSLGNADSFIILCVVECPTFFALNICLSYVCMNVIIVRLHPTRYRRALPCPVQVITHDRRLL